MKMNTKFGMVSQRMKSDQGVEESFMEGRIVLLGLDG